MEIVVDIGNSNVVVGVYREGTLIHHWRIATHPATDVNWHKNQLVTRMFEAGIKHNESKLVVMSSVVPDLTDTFEVFLSSLFVEAELITVGPTIYPALELEILRPDQIGSDLVANAYGAITKYRHNCLVVDFGTALTCLAVGIDWKIHGVSIAPGIKTAIHALHTNTAKLPEVELIVPTEVAGHSTEGAIQSGVMIGYIGLVKELIARYKQEWNSDAFVVATGGLSAMYSNIDLFDHRDPTLTIDGLRSIGLASRSKNAQ